MGRAARDLLFLGARGGTKGKGARWEWGWHICPLLNPENGSFRPPSHPAKKCNWAGVFKSSYKLCYLNFKYRKYFFHSVQWQQCLSYINGCCTDGEELLGGSMQKTNTYLETGCCCALACCNSLTCHDDVLDNYNTGLVYFPHIYVLTKQTFIHTWWAIACPSISYNCTHTGCRQSRHRGPCI